MSCLSCRVLHQLLSADGCPPQIPSPTSYNISFPHGLPFFFPILFTLVFVFLVAIFFVAQVITLDNLTIL